ncbi:MAG: heme A synthase [Proteobacteria bacterium]|nr:heme A synthase [Pseudomonadota bacterium]
MFVNQDPYQNNIRRWLILMFSLIILIIAVGGLTRLTDSGLSITEWELFKGILPPFTSEKWNFYFDEYKQIPEFKSINYDMTLTEFKVIFYWEYIHRLIARLIGLLALIPLLIISLKYKKKLISDFKYLSIFLLICVQGTVGWYMVTSGLVNNTDVSHYRLALHLSIALIILSINFWFILQTLKISSFKVHFNNSFLNFFLILIIFQIILGAFLAGMDGGLIYNSWPDMNGSFVPNDIAYVDLFLFSSLDNPSVIQFYHRFTAYLLFISLLFLNYYTYRTKIDFKPVLILNIAIFVQIVLGIVTLITGVKITYASLHQLGSVFVLTSFLYIKYKNTIN